MCVHCTCVCTNSVTVKVQSHVKSDHFLISSKFVFYFVNIILTTFYSSPFLFFIFAYTSYFWYLILKCKYILCNQVLTFYFVYSWTTDVKSNHIWKVWNNGRQKKNEVSDLFQFLWNINYSKSIIVIVRSINLFDELHEMFPKFLFCSLSTGLFKFWWNIDLNTGFPINVCTIYIESYCSIETLFENGK